MNVCIYIVVGRWIVRLHWRTLTCLAYAHSYTNSIVFVNTYRWCCFDFSLHTKTTNKQKKKVGQIAGIHRSGRSKIENVELSIWMWSKLCICKHTAAMSPFAGTRSTWRWFDIHLCIKIMMVILIVVHIKYQLSFIILLYTRIYMRFRLFLFASANVSPLCMCEVYVFVSIFVYILCIWSELVWWWIDLVFDFYRYRIIMKSENNSLCACKWFLGIHSSL